MLNKKLVKLVEEKTVKYANTVCWGLAEEY